MMMLSITAITISTAHEQSILQSVDDVELSVSSGNLGLDIGFGIAIDVLNHRSENVTVYYNISRDRILVKDFPTIKTGNFTVPPEKLWGYGISIGDGLRNGLKSFRLYNILITVKCDNILVVREGITIGEIMIFLN